MAAPAVHPQLDRIVADVLLREGAKFTDDPLDRGGPTRFGITQSALSKWLGKAATVDEVRSLSRKTAAAIMIQDYYLKPRINALPVRLQAFMLDASVHHGPARAIKLLQQTCEEAGFLAPEEIDGVCGPITMAAATTADRDMGDWLLAAVVETRRMLFHALIETRPNQRRFLKGWLIHRIQPFWPPSLKGRLPPSSIVTDL